MRKISGNISLMSLADITQWADNSMRSGTLTISHQNRLKKFYFQDGKIIFVWSDAIGERIADFLQVESALTQQALKENIDNSESLGLPFIGYLLSRQIVSWEEMKDILKRVAKTAMSDAMSWETGDFEFVDELPSFVLNGPVRLDTSQILMESVQVFDETRQEENINYSQITEEIRNRIKNGVIELPPIPDIIQRIAEKIEDPNINMDQIAECINDQILVTKILRICNSPYYRTTGKISSIRDAVVLIGLKSLMSIVTVHALSGFSPKNSEDIRKVLRHSLVCAMIARQIARDMGGNHEQAFMCGLLHDIGKTVMFNLAGDYMLTAEARNELINEHHTEIGQLLAQKWNFSEDIKEVILYHHTPESAQQHRNIVDIIFLANLMAHSSGEAGSTGELFLSWSGLNSSMDIPEEHINQIVENIDNLDREAWDILD
ncbi:MAG TPA: HDOD domain-containing protein [Deltaproteobacteria bacterium]|nr:HDOD domain-containing protein [Deltaproteobacteria bacterium]HQB38283.1 HDOD domain-containing protein [Deltaproteobacteria bacterium]